MNRHVAIERKYVDGPCGQIHFIKAHPNGSLIQIKPPLVCFHQSPVSGAQKEIAAEVRRFLDADT